MTPSYDMVIVVDPDLRVLGTGGLRLADASMSRISSSRRPKRQHTMTGWKAHDFIVEDGVRGVAARPEQGPA